MSGDDEKSLSDQHTFSGGSGGREDSPKSLGDQATMGGAFSEGDSRSLGDQSTFGDTASGGEAVFDDGMEVVDLSSRYRIEGVLGKGGMGEVLLATDTRLNRKVAIKRMLGDAAKSQTAVQRFLTEAQSIASLNHPNIVQIYDYGRSADGPFLIMEHVEGSNLLEKCREGALPPEEAVDLTCQLCDGLGKAHGAGIIHRDIKPANVLLTVDGVPKLTDFGLAKDETANTGHTMAGAVLGTLDFMPPEQRRDAAHTDARSDLWSLAATLYQMLTGKSPKVIRLNDVPRSLQDVLSKALEDNKEDRYQTAKEFRDALNAALQGAGQYQLEEGSCPKCGVKNPVDRKFCRNEACGADLQVCCLSCTEKIPIWEKVCGSCGAKQGELLEKRRAEMASQQSEAESLLRDYDFDHATKLAMSLRDEPDLRLQHLKGWAEKFLSTVEQRRLQQLERVDTLLGEALQHERAYDYSSGIHTLEQVPEILRAMKLQKQSKTIHELLTQLKEKQSRSQNLFNVIRERVESRQLHGLQQEVDELLKLRPDRKDIQKLKQQLVDREAKLEKTRDEAYESAKQKLAAHDYDGVLEEIARIDPSMLDADSIDRHFVDDEPTYRLVDDEDPRVSLPENVKIAQLRELAIEKRGRMVELQKSIDIAVRDKHWHGLLKRVREYLTLKSDDAKMIQLRDRLLERDKKNAAQVANVLEKVRVLHAECKFDAAVMALQKIPLDLQTADTMHLLFFSRDVAKQRSNAIEALRQGRISEDYETAMELVKGYMATLDSEKLEDNEFQQLLISCHQGQKQQKNVALAAVRQKELLVELVIGAGALTVVILLVAALLWVRSSMRANALAEAVQQQQWDAALAIDPNSVPALIGRANHRLSSGTPDVAAAFTDLELAERLDGSASGLQQAKATAYAKRARASAEAGKISEAERDLKQAEQLQAAESLLTAVRQPLAAFYIQQAEAAVQAGNGSEVMSLTIKALQCDSAATVPVVVLEASAEESVKQYEASSSDESRDTALTQIDKLLAADVSSVKAPMLRQRVGVVLLKRSESTVKSDLTSAAESYILGLQLGAAGNATLKSQITQALTTRCQQSLANQDAANAAPDYALLQRLGAQTASGLVAEFAKLPLDVLLQIFPNIPVQSNSIGLEFKLLPGGVFKMGHGRYIDSNQVTLTKPFEIGVYEVTQEQYERVMGENPSKFKDPQNPVEEVSWDDAVEFCRKLSALPAEKAAGYVYRLPTEAEWEYACRAGTDTNYCFGDDEAQLCDYAWYNENSNHSTHPVGQKKPNPWGLYDMHGNVYEWCQDWYDVYPSGPMTDPTGPSSGSLRVYRGGSWSYASILCGSAFRLWYAEIYLSGIGFRVVRSSIK